MVDHEIFSLQLKAGILFVTFAATILLYFRVLTKPSRQKKDWKGEVTSTKVSETKSSNDDYEVKDVWGERRKRGVTASSSSSKITSAAEDKPFGSSYYYAHNNPNATGGYKDGLKMEDFTMNQPRLLSMGGVPAELNDVSSETIEPSSAHSTEQTQTISTVKRVNAPVAKRISKFLWDDPGESSGIATIRIDVLPGAALGETITWREAHITETTVSLIDDKKGLLIELESCEKGTRYRLQIPKLYGQVDEVRKVVKPNRLLVRLYKKKGWMNKKNLQAWPNP